MYICSVQIDTYTYKTILLYSIFRANCILEEVFIDLKNIKCFEELMTKQWYEKHVLYKLIMFKVHVACMRFFFSQQVRKQMSPSSNCRSKKHIVH